MASPPAGRPPGGSHDPERLREAVERLRHDLGKYVAFLSVNLPASSWERCDADLAGALAADILSTRTKPDGTPRPAWEVFETVTAGLPRPLPFPELEAVAESLEVLRAAAPALERRDLSALAPQVPAISAAQGRIRRALRDLSRRLADGAH